MTAFASTSKAVRAPRITTTLLGRVRSGGLQYALLEKVRAGLFPATRSTTQSASPPNGAPRLFRCLSAPLLALLLTACAGLPSSAPRTLSTALTNTGDTAIGRAVAPMAAPHPGLSGFHPLTEGPDAFAARIALVQAAQLSVDLQYFIWHHDTTGLMLWEALWQAAERGVRVRVLLDDHHTLGQDAMLAAMDAHSNIELRLFNPYVHRSFRTADLMLDFSRVNRRMHNKSLTIDNQVTIVGGRNVGDEYYGANQGVAFQDLDMLGIGPVVKDVSSEFDLYWNHDVVYPASTVLPPPAQDAIARVRAAWSRVHADPAAQIYINAARNTEVARRIAAHDLPFEWTTARVVHDSPEKGRRTLKREELLVARLIELMGDPRKELDLVSPYFVPGKESTEMLIGFAKRGVKVRVLTNSLLATDVLPVHAGYSKYRLLLLQGGVRLYELKPQYTAQRWDAARALAKKLSGQEGREVLQDATQVQFDDTDLDPASRPRPSLGLGLGPGGSAGSGSSMGSGGISASSLHAKTFGSDRRLLFVGSFNLDPRSEQLNTEMGVVIDSAAIAEEMTSLMDDVVPERAYEVRLQPDGRNLEWVERLPQGEQIWRVEPGSTAGKRLLMNVLQVLPIEWLL